jgi:hypothetical protein
MRRPESQSLRYRLALALGLAMLFAATARAEDKRPARQGYSAPARCKRRRMAGPCGFPTDER